MSTGDAARISAESPALICVSPVVHRTWYTPKPEQAEPGEDRRT